MSKNLSEKKSVKTQKRQRIFDIFSKNLGFVKRNPALRFSPDFDEGYICPLCMNLFKNEALTQGFDDSLTLEHIPPQSLGGKGEILTCKKCNNQSGTKLDSHLVKGIHAQAFFSGVKGLTLDGFFKPGTGISLPATFNFLSKNNINITYFPARSNPLHLEEFRRLEDNKGISNINLSFEFGYNPDRFEDALLRTAYLLAFSKLGYGFLINPNLKYVREQIAGTPNQKFPIKGIVKLEESDNLSVINIITEPKKFRAFLIVIHLKYEALKFRYGVLLPGPYVDSIKVYEQVADLLDKRGKFAMRHNIKTIPETNFLSSAKLAFASLNYWIEICGGGDEIADFSL